MKRFPIALQLYSVRDDMAADFEGTLKKVKELGYDGVEFAGLFNQSPADVRKLLDTLGLVAVSAHVPYVDMLENPEKVMDDYAALGCRFVAVPYIDKTLFYDKDKFAEFATNLNMLGKAAADKGMTLLYHNHDFEFQKVEGEYALDMLYRTVPAERLKTQLDTCWVNVGGENPADYLRKYAGRAPIVHLKDFVGQKSEKMYALIGIDDGDQKSEQPQSFEFRPLGYGYQKFPGILEAAEQAGADWVVVEQDMPSMGKTPMECAAMSIQYLKTLY